MTYDYTATVTIAGALTFTAAAGATPDFGLADGLTITRTLPQSDFYPLQPDPATAQLTIVVETPEDAAAALNIGATIFIKVTATTGGEVLETFAGRIADVEVSPLMLGPAIPGGPERPAVAIQLICADYLADLAELVPGIGYVAGPASVRASSIATAGGITVVYAPWVPGITVAPDIATMTARAASTDSVAAMLEETFSSWAVEPDWAPTAIGDPGWGAYRYTVAPNTDATTGALINYLFVPTYERSRALPGLLGDTGDGYGVTMPPSIVGDTQNVSLDGCRVNRGIKWSRRKGGGVNTVVVSSATASATAQLAGVTVPVTARVDGVPVSGGPDLGKLARLFLPATDGNPWGVDVMVWEQWADTEGLIFPALGQVVAVGGILDEWSPAVDRTWVAGVVGSREFTLSGGKPRVAFTIRQAVTLTTSAVISDMAQWDDVDPAITWDQLNTQDTWDDYGLLGR